MSNKKSLFEEDSSDEEKIDVSNKINVNKSYADNYEKWRRKEEYQKLKDKYGEDIESDDSSTDNEFAGTDCPEFDLDFFRVVAALELKHPIVNEDRKFFKDKYEFKSENMKSEDEKPLTIKEYERKIILEKGGAYDDEDEHGPNMVNEDFQGMSGDLKNKKNIGFADDNLSENEEEENDNMSAAGLFKRKETQNSNDDAKRDQRPNDAIAFLKGEKNSLGNKLDEELLGGLKKSWQAKMSKKDKFLMDYFVNQRYLDDEDCESERAPNHYAFDLEPLSDDEETYNKMEEYESKYRFRFEEPDEDYIKGHSRIIGDSIRKKDAKRKEEREKKMQRKEDIEERRKQELMRMKAYKRKEILERIEKLRDIAGNDDLNFEEMDLDADFDPAAHDNIMNKLFDNDYYNEGTEERDKPSIEDEDLKRELEEEYAKLEKLDEMTEGSYKYDHVEANNFGLSTEEILMAKDTELNRWYSLKKMLRHERSRELELKELKNYCLRASMPDIKKKILPSLFTDNVEDSWAAEEERKRKRNVKKKERKLRRKEEQERLQSGGATEHYGHLDEPPLTKTALKKLKKALKEKATKELEQEANNDSVESTKQGNAENPKLHEKIKKVKKENPENIGDELMAERELETDDNSAAGSIIKQKGRKRKKKEKGTGELELEVTESVKESIIKKKKKKGKSNNESEEDCTERTDVTVSQDINKNNKNICIIGRLDDTFNPKNINLSRNDEASSSEENKTNILSKNKKRKLDKEPSEPSKKQKKQNKTRDDDHHTETTDKKDELGGISDARLAAYGANPKKLRKKLKYSNKS